MTREVWIKMSGSHTVDGQQQDTVVTQGRGIYNMQGGKHYLRYEDHDEAASGIVNTRVKFYEGFMEVVKKGAIDSKMTFEAGKEVMTRYSTPVGAIELGVEAYDVHVEETPRRIVVSSTYALHGGGQKVQESRVEIEVIPFPIV